jgi:hypothetical protein
MAVALEDSELAPSTTVPARRVLQVPSQSELFTSNRSLERLTSTSSVRFLLAASIPFVGMTGCADDEAPSSEIGGTSVKGDPVVLAHIEVVRWRIAANNAKDWQTWESVQIEHGYLVAVVEHRASIQMNLTKNSPMASKCPS